ncbi:hypothetical protein SDC9_141128 [bioreactor metagenome]|uniref:Uncharacterized protein n=1 Tax=bioreactor metagenome TaxID=1076179 RepID=A0A645DXB6_9ZZZZ
MFVVGRSRERLYPVDLHPVQAHLQVGLFIRLFYGYFGFAAGQRAGQQQRGDEV